MQKLDVDDSGSVSGVIETDRPRIINLYCLHDTVAGESGPIFQAVNDQIAKRSVIQLLKNSDFPQDYILFKVGFFDPSIPAIMDIEISKIDFILDLEAYKLIIKKRGDTK